MQLNQIKPIFKKKKRKRIGRGGKRGTYSGRGLKGQKARAGRKMRPELRDIIKKIPKKRGYKFPSLKSKITVVNLGQIDSLFEAKEKINPKTLSEKGIIRNIKGRIPEVKLLGAGQVTKAFLVSECQISEKVAEKIKKAGGEVVLSSTDKK